MRRIRWEHFYHNISCGWRKVMKERVLLVDDEEGIRNVLSISLADAG